MMALGENIQGLIIATALGAALVAGIFFAFSTFVMKALERLSPSEGIAAMQSINVTVLNPWFFSAFFGTALGAACLAVLGGLHWGEPDAGALIAGGGFYLLGCILVTIAGNVPLNNALASVDPNRAEGGQLWKLYLVRWTAWNHLRTVMSFVSAVLFIAVLWQG